MTSKRQAARLRKEKAKPGIAMCRPQATQAACKAGQLEAFTFPKEAAITSAFIPNLSLALCGP